MSKAFDTNSRKKCIKTLQEHPDEVETRMFRYHMARERLGTYVEKNSKQTFTPFKVTVSIRLFTTYLFKATEGMRKEAMSQNINKTSYADD